MLTVLVSRLVPLLLLAAGACAKTSPEVQSAAAAPASAGSGKNESAEDTTPPPGVDLTKLDDFERKVFFRIINKEASACGKAHSLAFSVRNDKGCRKSLYAVRAVAKLVDQGFTDSEIAEALQRRFRAGPPKSIDVSDAP